MPSARLHIYLLGDFRLTDGAPPTAVASHGVNTARLQALLTYLLLHRHAPQSRAHLAFLFWPETSEAQALTNLRNLLHKLRHALPNPIRFLQIDSRTVQWRPDAPYTLDIADFEAAVTQATTVADLAHAVQFYQGDLLPNCYDEWIQPERERLRQLALNALERLLDLLEAQRDYRRAIRYGQQLLQLEPLNEAIYRRLMTLYAAAADRAGALQSYQRCVAMLEAEFAATPDPATTELYQRLQQNALPRPRPGRTSAEQPTLVGRIEEWQRLTASWSRAVSGQPHSLLLTGEAGIGKTRLAEELCSWVERQGFVTAAAHCYAAEGLLAYAPVVAWLRTPAINRALATLAPLWLTEVARLLPELLTTYPHLAPPGALTAGWQRQRLFEALARALLQAGTPLLLLLDDLQWCDRDSVEWLHYLLRFAQESSHLIDAKAAPDQRRLLLIGTVRSEEMHDNHPLHDLLLALQRDGQLTELALGPLDATETAALATAVAGQPLTPEQNSYLYAQTEGNPLFVVETVRAEIGRDGLRKQSAVRLPLLAPSSLTDPATPLPPKVHAVIHARLADLSPATRELAGLAATIGRAFPFAVLAKASKRDDEALVNSLDELCQRQIVRERSADTYDFTHDKLREATYNSLSAARRRLLHKWVAGAMEALYTDPDRGTARKLLEAVSGQIATHYELAGEFAQAIHYYQQAAAAAHQLSANREAVRACRRAIALLEGPAAQLQTDATPLYEQLGDLLHGTSEYAEARTVLLQALSHVTTLDAITCARFHRKIGNTWREQYHYADAVACYSAAAHALEMPALTDAYRAIHQLPANHPLNPTVKAVDQGSAAWWEEWLQIQLEIDLVHYWLGETDTSATLQSQLQPLVEQHASPGQQAAFFQRRAQLEFRRQRAVATAAAVAYSERSFAVYRAAGMQDQLPAAHFMLGFTLLWHDDLARAADELQITLRLAEANSDLSLQARALAYLTIAARRSNQIEETATFVTQALAVATAAHMVEYMAMARANQAWLAWRQQTYAAVRDHGHAALDLWQQLPVTHASAPFQWLALWPLLAEALLCDALAIAIGYARALLDPHQQQLPDPVATPLVQALQVWEEGASVQAAALLHQALTQAQQRHYL